MALFSSITNVFKTLTDENRGALLKAKSIVPLVNAREEEVRGLSDDALRAKTAELKARYSAAALNGQTAQDVLDSLLPEAFALVREASRRTLGQRHYDVQLIGGAVIHNGDIAEMRTGEGKTLVATLPAYLNSLTGRGVHVVTVNDYLSRRDAVWMGQVYFALGLSVAVINHEVSFLYDPAAVKPSESEEKDASRDVDGSFKIEHDFLRPVSRHEAYMADITYGTNNEFGFDFLRDNLVYHPNDLRQREHSFAIVDEIDSILIDEARTPLIISAPSHESGEIYAQFAQIARGIVRGDDYLVDEKLRAISLKPSGIEKAEAALGVDNIYTDKGIKYVHHLEVAVRADALFHNNQEYVVKNNEVVIVDELTGRMQPGRRWSEGLHQAIEAKEGVPVQKESRTYASITFQNYFRMYGKVAGMAGTAATSSEEFYKVYGLNTVIIPTNIPPKRVDHNDLIFKTQHGKWKAIARKVEELHKKGQPVLVGTVSVENNELLSGYLHEIGVPHEVLNAKNHEREGAIIAAAGETGAVTVATNMAGRGVDIKLGGVDHVLGKAEGERLAADVQNVGGLFVLGTERHEARRIDNQLRGRSGRQGDPGETQFFVSVEDSLMRVFGGDRVKSVMELLKVPEDEAIQNRMITRSLETAQEKIEGFNFDNRKHVLAYDDVINVQRQSVYARRRRLLVGDSAQIDSELLHVVEAYPDVLPLIEKKKLELARKVPDAPEGATNKDVLFYDVSRRMMLQSIDMLWVDHLELMDYTRQNVNLRAYGQRDPLVEYKKEAAVMFKDMEAAYVRTVSNLLANMQVEMFEQPKQPDVRALVETQEGAELAAKSMGGDRHAGPSSSSGHTHGRNDVVTITNGTETKQMKYKKAEELLKQGWSLQK
jgi:preprotein translocase subunit SecA